MADYRETIKIYECFGIDEVNCLFRFHTEILPITNIESCAVTPDTASLPQNLFHQEEVFGMGKIPFINDIKELSKAVRENDIFLTIYFSDKDGNSLIFKKRYPYDSNEVYALASKINSTVSPV